MEQPSGDIDGVKCGPFGDVESGAFGGVDGSKAMGFGLSKIK